MKNNIVKDLLDDHELALVAQDLAGYNKELSNKIFGALKFYNDYLTGNTDLTAEGKEVIQLFKNHLPDVEAHKQNQRKN